jgi:hypothetical protein
MKNSILFIFFILFLYPDKSSAQVFPGDLVITEYMADPVAVTDANGEWIEIFNASNNDIELNGFYISDGGADTLQLVSASSLIVPPGGYFVLGTNSNIAANGGVSTNYTMGGFTVNNNTGSLIITDSLFNVIDEISYNTTTPGKSNSLDPFYYDAISNDNQQNWCEANVIYGAGDFGTPGANNPSCATGIDENKQNVFQVYVKDNRELVILGLQVQTALEIADAAGKIIYSTTGIDYRTGIDLSAFTNGLYIYRLYTNEECFSGKFIK